MKEETILEAMNNLIEMFNPLLGDPVIIFSPSNYQKAIQGLLDLYEKEKKNNKELEEEDVKIRAKFILQLDNYIPKSKVEEKIEELERELKLSEKQHIDTIKVYTPIDIIKAEIKRLQEILEEE